MFLLLIFVKDRASSFSIATVLTYLWLFFQNIGVNPANFNLLKFNNRNTGEIYSKLTIKTLERRHGRRSGVFIINFEPISHFLLVFLWLTLNK